MASGVNDLYYESGFDSETGSDCLLGSGVNDTYYESGFESETGSDAEREVDKGDYKSAFSNSPSHLKQNSRGVKPSQSPLHGFGVFVHTTLIPSSTIISWYDGELRLTDRHDASITFTYGLDMGDDADGNCIVLDAERYKFHAADPFPCFGHLLNTSHPQCEAPYNAPNCAITIRGEGEPPAIQTIRDVGHGEELLIDYHWLIREHIDTSPFRDHAVAKCRCRNCVPTTMLTGNDDLVDGDSVYHGPRANTPCSNRNLMLRKIFQKVCRGYHASTSENGFSG